MMERGQTLKAEIDVGGRVTPALPSRMRRPGREWKMWLVTAVP